MLVVETLERYKFGKYGSSGTFLVLVCFPQGADREFEPQQNVLVCTSIKVNNN